MIKVTLLKLNISVPLSFLECSVKKRRASIFFLKQIQWNWNVGGLALEISLGCENLFFLAWLVMKHPQNCCCPKCSNMCQLATRRESLDKNWFPKVALNLDGWMLWDKITIKREWWIFFVQKIYVFFFIYYTNITVRKCFGFA